ncbi:MAG: hypothetical protein ABH851_03440, partial [Methanobacteriota archaeon]
MVERILVMGFAGIGDTLLTTPALSLLKESFPKIRITALVTSKSQLSVLKNNPEVDEILLAEGVWKNPVTFIKNVLRIRSSHFDVAITFYPTTRILFNILAFACEAPKRIVHSYPGDKYRKLSFLQNEQVPLLHGGHSVDQNFALLKPLGVDLGGGKKVRLTLNFNDLEGQVAKKFLSDNGILSSDVMVGFHAGSGGMEYKRWPLDRFI